MQITGRNVYLGVVLGLITAWTAQASEASAVSKVNEKRIYPVIKYARELVAHIDTQVVEGEIDPRIYGTNLEWFNNAGGLATRNQARMDKLVNFAKEQGITNFRFPGGILADYYDWRDGIGPQHGRKTTQHPTDSGKSTHYFGSPELFELMQKTGAEALLTVNAGTGSAQQAAAWVSYANDADNKERIRDGFKEPIGVKLWEVGNELYLPGNPQEKKISVSPKLYAKRYLKFSSAMRAVDPDIELMALATADSHNGPRGNYPDWTELVLREAADEIDYLAVHNAYFPLLYKVRQPSVESVYSALWATPEAVDKSLSDLEALIARYEGKREIGIAITEWGALFSVPRADPYWVDHVKTLGSGIYIARLMQVFMSHPRVKVTNYFKFVDRSFMGWVSYEGVPKVPYWIFKLYARYSGNIRVQATIDSPVYHAKALSIMAQRDDVPEVTVLASMSRDKNRLYLNMVNRSMKHQFSIKADINDFTPEENATLYSISAAEPTAHNGRDIPPEWPYRQEYEPYSSSAKGEVSIAERSVSATAAVQLKPFSVATLVLQRKRDK